MALKAGLVSTPRSVKPHTQVNIKLIVKKKIKYGLIYQSSVNFSLRNNKLTLIDGFSIEVRLVATTRDPRAWLYLGQRISFASLLG